MVKLSTQKMKNWVKALKNRNENTTFSIERFNNYLEQETGDAPFNSKELEIFEDFVNQESEIELCFEKVPRTVKVRIPFKVRVEQYKEQLDEEYHDMFDWFVSRGCSPETVILGVKYLKAKNQAEEDEDSDWMQSEFLGRHGWNEVSLRNFKERHEQYQAQTS